VGLELDWVAEFPQLGLLVPVGLELAVLESGWVAEFPQLRLEALAVLVLAA
jgi:hypothetical protein